MTSSPYSSLLIYATCSITLYRTHPTRPCGSWSAVACDLTIQMAIQCNGMASHHLPHSSRHAATCATCRCSIFKFPLAHALRSRRHNLHGSGRSSASYSHTDHNGSAVSEFGLVSLDDLGSEKLSYGPDVAFMIPSMPPDLSDVLKCPNIRDQLTAQVCGITVFGILVIMETYMQPVFISSVCT